MFSLESHTPKSDESWGRVKPLLEAIRTAARMGLIRVQTLFWASTLGLLPAFLLAFTSGQFIALPQVWGRPEITFVISSIAHVAVYTSYVWLIGRAGPVFTSQIRYTHRMPKPENNIRLNVPIELGRVTFKNAGFQVG